MRERQPDEEYRVKVGSLEVQVYSFGRSEEVLLCVNGGPGLPCEYLRDSHSALVDRGYRVVIHDQLGTGRSDRPTDKSLWTLKRYVEEIEAVRDALELGRVHLLGHSWGTWLGFEYLLRYRGVAKTFVCANGSAEIQLNLRDINRYRTALGPETVAMMELHEAEGTTDHPEYQAAITILNYRHFCRLKSWPVSLRHSVDDLNMEIYGSLWGPNEFTCTGPLKSWDRLADIHEIEQPCLVLCGRYDETPPESAARICGRLRNSQLRVFDNSSHTPFFEEPERYLETLTEFLDRHRS
jgi:proline iminopeptidase